MHLSGLLINGVAGNLDGQVSLGGDGDVTIADDDTSSITLTAVGSAAQPEGTPAGTTAFTFEVKLSNAVQGGFSIAYSTDDVTALVSNNDYQDNDGVLNFTGAANEIHTITVLVNHDSIVELDETFEVKLASALTGLDAQINPSAISIQSAASPGTISNDDSTQVTIGNASVIEGTVGPNAISFTVSLTSASSQDVTVLVNTADNSATVADPDYTVQSNVIVTIPAGSLSAAVVIPISVDSKVELDETFTATISSPTFGGVADPTRVTLGAPVVGTGTIINDDTATVSISASLPNAAEPGTNGEFTLTMSEPSSTDTIVTLTITGAASNGTDYQLISTPITIAANTTVVTIPVTVIDDLIGEFAESVTVAIASTDNSAILPGVSSSATVTISSDELPDTTAPTVGSVKVSGPWTGAFKNFVDPADADNSDGSDGVGYQIPTDTMANQLTPLTWININTIVLSFSEPVTGVSLANIEVVGVNKPDYKVSGGSGPQLNNVLYNPLDNTATLSFNGSLTPDKLLIYIAAGDVQDTAGNPLGTLSFRINVLPGDANQSGGVTTSDVSQVRNSQGAEVGDGTYSIFRDINGSSGITTSDVSAARTQQGSELPDGEPSLPAEGEGEAGFDASLDSQSSASDFLSAETVNGKWDKLVDNYFGNFE